MSKKSERGLRLSKVSGTIRCYKATRGNGDFVFTDSDRAALGVVAVAAAIVGLSGQAASTASHARDTEESADYLEFMINDISIKGWVWRSPFKNGDTVDVVGNWVADHFELVGIRRAADRTIALYPHCSRGRFRHWKTGIFWWATGTTFFMGFVFLMLFYIGGVALLRGAWDEGAGYIYAAVYAFFAIATFSMSKQWMPIVRLAEDIFRALDFPNPSNVDLVKSSRRQRTPNDPGEFGTFYFRY